MRRFRGLRGILRELLRSAPACLPSVFSPVLFSMSFVVLSCLACSSPLPVSGRRLRGQRFVMHFVGDGVGFRRRVLVIVFLVVFVIGVLVAFSITFVIGIQRFLQLLEFGGLYIRFGHGFDRLGPLFGIGLRFFVLGLGQLLGERGYIFVGKA